jgi:PAS domain-containing protein
VTRAEAPDVAKDLLPRVLDALDTGVLAIDEDRRIVAINETLAKGWGVSADDVTGKSLGDVFEPETERWYLPERGSKGDAARATREVRGTVGDREVLMRYNASTLGDDGAVLIRVEDLVDADSEEEIIRNTERLISLGELHQKSTNQKSLH